MLLHEFVENNEDMVLLTGIVSQIFNRIKDTGFNKEYSLKSLLDTLSDRGLDLDREEFEKMIKHQPLKHLISNIKGDKIIFKGKSETDTDAMDPDETTSTLEKMAKRAANK
jgi:hypothetical protein